MTARHPQIRRLRRLSGRRSARQDEQAFVVEGAKNVAEALASSHPVEAVFAAPGADDQVLTAAARRGAVVHHVADGVLAQVLDAVTPQPEAAIVGVLDAPLDTLATAGFVVVCVDVRDPGNLGTILRTAEAAGADGVVCCAGSVDLYNPKTVRASAGALFHLPVVAAGAPVEVLDRLAGFGLRRLGTEARHGRAHTDVDLTRRVALVLGNEANGLPGEVGPSVDEWVTIPIHGRSESLNVGMAAAVVCFEASRQRRGATATGDAGDAE